jgi:hypothetical protein
MSSSTATGCSASKAASAFATGSGLDGHVAPTAQRFRQRPADQLLVVNDENFIFEH